MLRSLVQNPKVRARVLERVDEFRLNNLSNEEVWFRELTLCLLTANSSFISAYQALNCLGQKIYYANEEEIRNILKSCKYRFYNLKAKYIIMAREKVYGRLKEEIKPLADEDQQLARERLLNIKGIGMKEASHFLRNVGYFDLAIIDRHIIDFMRRIGAIGETNVKQLSKSLYISFENILKSIASNLNMSVGILDLFIWYKETNTIVK
ncbi:N-glycosylase/DNA lyase [Saccharolobus solfataricus]|uniref:8-oxoguanine DNA glycosylase/AP lyase n=3 Tax=Saccharolobus solfataricus TaxID=2287 RepID=OGG1_SACS2|nr:N-glycosylase/DNA lyase [Saccharolobus solfataricus]Q97ZK2.1 RecName: Full=8-oxoguanine DNA glycosylase/AP lyase; Includes: RecName: Full=8-oxoguanine DNA glycosylase; Short=8-oxoG DNA glycosylase; Includes: RecName: Full=DNA-(apurinic or apyrimidinic site) lyase; Short=AP lyase [Saccharolobus solfataricus P2]AAK41186.1 8-oxoguanine DNA glycosylase (ogG) [Saccharolobus solfataricus P2]AKA74139.1 N-glycosylase/DNA lyase [Saccharolobus solfataricus]AKA76837.1 N-glycosylase/DNA lyase [Saccharol